MSLLAALGLDAPGPLMLVAAPDSVLAAAGRLSPRPALASSIMTAEPTPRMAWWPEERFFTPAALSRLHWMLSAGQGEAWLIIDPDEDLPPRPEVERILAAQQLPVSESRTLAGGELALRVTPTQEPPP